ncbi:MAG: arginine decarboxylase, pyruvoyl-dependent [Clostridia bacterium]|nr:arginine decarboxylase, pyruvoyl-dependent [Clostridia bacterium]
MLPTPKKVKLAVGSAEGETRLTAFDKALLAAGIGNLNLMKVSSILPPNCVYDEDFVVPPGSLTPTAYGYVTSDEPGALLAAAIGLGFSHDDYGVIMEFSGYCDREQAEEAVAAMVREAFAARGKELKELRVRAVSCRVERCAAAMAAAVLWY